MATSKQSNIIFANLLTGYKDEFSRAGSKDEVDNIETALLKNLRNNYSFRLNLLNMIVEAHELDDAPRVEEMRNKYAKDFDRLGSRIGQLSDQRRA
jgi:hypothetical protein